MIIVYLIVYLLFPAAILYNIRFEKKGSFNSGLVSKDESGVLKGIAAWFIMLSHYITNFGECGINTGAAKPFEWLGGIGVCIFFFISGYGLYMSSKNRKPSLKQLLFRELNVLIPMACVQLVFWLCYYGAGKSFGEMLLHITSLDGSLWFLSEIMLIYIIFFIALRFFKKFDILAVCVMCVIMSAVFYFCGLPARWYNANLVFALGMLFAKKREPIISFFKRKYALVLILSLLLFAALCAGYYAFKAVSLLSDVFKLLSGCALNIFLFALMLKLHLRSRIMAFFGKMSLYMFVVHVNVWAIVYNILGTGSPALLFCVCVAASCAITIGAYYIDKGVRLLFHKIASRP